MSILFVLLGLVNSAFCATLYPRDGGIAVSGDNGDNQASFDRNGGVMGGKFFPLWALILMGIAALLVLSALIGTLTYCCCARPFRRRRDHHVGAGVAGAGVGAAAANRHHNNNMFNQQQPVGGYNNGVAGGYNYNAAGYNAAGYNAAGYNAAGYNVAGYKAAALVQQPAGVQRVDIHQPAGVQRADIH